MISSGNECWNCGKPALIKCESPRHFCSPNGANWASKNKEEKWYEWYCSKECQKIRQDSDYAFLAELDRNASDSECFEHDHWEIDSLNRRIRVGRCNITGDEVRVEPLQPGDNSGQPRACYDHFILRKKYQEIIDKHVTTA